jgi:CubicO group peptidase (beta-lactamase class C family)
MALSRRTFAALPLLGLAPALAWAQDSPPAEVVAGAVKQGFSGAVLVRRGRAALVDGGYGGRSREGRFWIASGGKQFTAAAVVKLQGQGRLSLADPLSRFFPDAPADKAPITLRQLLSHTSGLGQSYVSEDKPDRASAVAAMLAEPLKGRPGERFIYSNANYQLSAAVVEVAGGRPYRDFVRQALWRPAGLTGSGFAGDPGARLVEPAAEPMPARLARTSWGAEGVYSTTGDLERWWDALHTGRVLPRAQAALLFEPAAPIQEGRAALGWFLGRTAKGTATIFTRGNEDWGPNSLIYAYPGREVLIVILTHAGDHGEVSWSRELLGRLETALGL